MGPVLALVSFVLLLLQLLLVARAVLDWSVALAGPSIRGSFRYRATLVVTRLTEPILDPVRRVVPPVRLGGFAIDLAFIIVFFAIVIVRALI